MTPIGRNNQEEGSALIAALLTILIVSLIGAQVLMNCTIRYNAASSHVRAWKDALHAAEAGGDLAYAECRKAVGGTPFTSAGWSAVNGAATPTWTYSPPSFGNGNLTTSITVDQFTSVGTSPYYRVRALGTAKLQGLKRTGMDSSRFAGTRGDNFLRHIDFNFDHFKAAFGNGDGVNPQITAVTYPQVTRRVELIAVPVLGFEGALKVDGSFSGPGSAGVVDSYDSHNGSYDRTIATTPSSPYYSDARNGNVAVNTPAFSQGGPIYGDVGTNGGSVTHSNSNISGTIDNTISFTLAHVTEPVIPVGNPIIGSDLSTITPTASSTNPLTPNWVKYSGNFDGVTITARKDPSNNPVETYINVIVNGDVGSVTIPPGVTLKVYFKGDVSTKARDLVNSNTDGAIGVKRQVYNADGTAAKNPDNSLRYVASDNVSRAGHMQFYGISGNPTQAIEIAPPGNVWATFYAPDADMSINGNPDMFGAIVCRNFSGNGNTGFHFDKALGMLGDPVDYRIASYVEDVR